MPMYECMYVCWSTYVLYEYTCISTDVKISIFMKYEWAIV